jgi:hypothetical protein
MAAERENTDQEHDEVIEAGLESFPASDPPSYNMPGRRRFASNRRAQQPKHVAAVPNPRATESPREPAAPANDYPPGAWRFTAWVAVVSAALLAAALLLR